MPNMKTVIKQEYSQLAYEHTDMTASLVYNQAFPAMGMVDETGQFRVGDSRDWYDEKFLKMSKFTKAEEHGESDSLANFNLTPQGIAWAYSNLDLNAPQKFGAMSRQEMIQNRVMIESALLKKAKEKACYTAVSTDANFESASYYADASVKWSTHATADPVGDVAAGKLVAESVNAMILPYRSYVDLQQCAKLQSLTGVQWNKRDGGVNPTIQVEWLLNVFQLDYIFVARGKLMTDSSNPAGTAKSDIWGNKALLFYFNPSQADKDGRFLKHLYLSAPGASTDEGWLVTETTDTEAGLLGVTRWQLGSYYQFLPHRKELGYRIDAIY